MNLIQRIGGEARQMVSLAAPIIVAQVAYVLMGLADTLMAGRAGPDELAAVSLGSGIWISIFMTMMGVVSALGPFVAHDFGARQFERIAPVAQQGLWLALILGVLSAVLLFQMRPLLLWSGASGPVVNQSMLYLQGIALGTPAGLLFRAQCFYSSSVSNSRPLMVYGLLGLLLNIPLNHILIYGKFGLPALGGAGCGWASGICLWVLWIAMTLHTRFVPFYRRFNLYHAWPGPDWRMLRRLVQLGLPIGGAYLVEVSAFASVALLIAPLGVQTLAANQVVQNFSALTYMLPQGLSLALSVRVSQMLGARQPEAAQFVTRVGLGLGLLCATVSASVIWFGRHSVVSWYSADLTVQHIAAHLLLFAALFQFADAIQVCAAAALRGYKVTAAPLLCMAAAFWCMSMPIGYRLALHPNPFPYLGITAPLGAAGFWISLLLGLGIAAILMLIGLYWVSQRAIHKALQGTENASNALNP